MASPVEVIKVHTYLGHKDAIYTLEKGPESNLFFSSGGDGQIIEWDLKNFESGRLIAKVPASVYALHYWSDKGLLIVGQNYEGIHLIDLESRAEKGSVKLTTAAIFDIKVYKNRALVAAGDGEFYVVDLDSLAVIKSSSIAEKNLRTIHVQGDTCFVGTSEGQVVEINLETLEIVNQVTVHDNSVFTLAQFSEEAFLLSGSRDARLKYWKTNPLELEESINAHMYAINHISFHPKGEYFATASMDKTVKIWDYSKRKLIKVIDKARHDGHLTSVNKLLWTGHNEWLISCSDDRSIGVWSLKIPK